MGKGFSIGNLSLLRDENEKMQNTQRSPRAARQAALAERALRAAGSTPVLRALQDSGSEQAGRNNSKCHFPREPSKYCVKIEQIQPHV